jgi:hypothetical protein
MRLNPVLSPTLIHFVLVGLMLELYALLGSDVAAKLEGVQTITVAITYAAMFNPQIIIENCSILFH